MNERQLKMLNALIKVADKNRFEADFDTFEYHQWANVQDGLKYILEEDE